MKTRQHLLTLGLGLLSVGMMGCAAEEPHKPSVTPVSAATGQPHPKPHKGTQSPTETLTAPPSGPPAQTMTTKAGTTLYTLPTKQKTVALTFDDGPSKYTPQVLAILQKEGITATFFQLGQNVDIYPNYTKMLADASMSIQGHSYQHENFNSTSNEGITRSVKKTNKTISKTVGRTPQCTRPPYGAHTKRVDAVLKKSNQGIILWSVDSLDWSKPGAATIIRNSTKDVKPGSILLFHDGGGNREQTIQALPTIIKTLKKNGYTFTTIC